MTTAAELWARVDADNLARAQRSVARHWERGERARARGDQEYALACFKRSARSESRLDELERSIERCNARSAA